MRPRPNPISRLVPRGVIAACCGLLTPLAPASPSPEIPLAGAYPAPGAMNICPDTPLRLSFSAPVELGSSGVIHVVDAATGRDADAIDLASPTATKTIGGEPNFRYYPITISGRAITLHLHNGYLAYGKTYVVAADPGVFRIGGAPSGGLTPALGWTFTTRPSPPKPGTTRLIVAENGTGDFCTVQGAIDFVPDGNTTPTTIHIRAGTYVEQVFFANKHALTIEGDDRTHTVIAYATNERFNRASGNPFGSARPNPAAAAVGGHHIYHRGVFLAHRCRDLVLANLTIRNLTPQGGSQAEAIILNGTTDAHAILNGVNLYSYQDTLQINGQAYISDCHIEGDVDFLWGTGPCYFERCTLMSLRSDAFFTQIRNPGTNHGYVFDRCQFEGAPGVTGNYLSRIGTGRFPHSEVVLLDCTLTPAVGATGWRLLGGKEGNENDPAAIHFWEYNSREPSGHPVDTSKRMRGSKQLTDPADAETIANYRNPAWVLGGWSPPETPARH